MGFLLISISFFINYKYEFQMRWLYGTGVLAFIFYVFCLSFLIKSADTQFMFSEEEDTYLGYVIDIPDEKTKTISCNIKLTHPEKKKIIIYIQKDSLAYTIKPGTELMFRAKMQRFKNMGNPYDFDYARYMKNQGYSASAYIPSHKWLVTGKTINTITTTSQRLRILILDFYRSFELSTDAFAFISALTIGYKADLTEKVQNAFRISGTAHVLAVSGMHVGIIYYVFSGLLSFLGTFGFRYTLKQLLIILFLWIYAFVTGLSPGVMRAVIMLSLACVGKAIGRDGFSFNTLAISAFIILFFKPYTLLDVGFQMSFVSVLAILYFIPEFYKIYSPKRKWVKTVWDMFIISVAAQLGVFPIVLHYFGTFPVYFIFTNLLIVPLTTIITYICLITPIAVLLSYIPFRFFEWFYEITIEILRAITDFTLDSIYFFESLPNAQLSGLYVNTLQELLLITIIIGISIWIIRRRSKYLITSLTVILIFIITQIFSSVNCPRENMVVFNKSDCTEIYIMKGKDKTVLNIMGNGFLPHPTKRILRLSKNNFKNKSVNTPLHVDALILSEDSSFILKDIASIVDADIIIIDSSLPAFTLKTITDDASKLGIKLHDVTKMGAYSINL